jgi:glucose/arabinose dehydrogenase
MDREMEILEAMATNRDKRVWAVAKGADLTIDDSNLPKHIPVLTNLAGKGPGGSHIFATGEGAIKSMKVHEGMKVSLFASEEDFPELINPVQMAFDTKGRLWVVAWKSYPHYKPGQGLVDKLLILEDTDGDGKADKCKTFADKLDSPTGFEFWGGGVIVACAPNLLFIKDTDGDDKADETTILLSGISSGDTHHTANSFVLDPGGSLYFGEGTFHRTQVETPHGTLRNKDGCIWRFEPRTSKLTRFMPRSFANPHGHVYDRWGQGFLHDGTGAQPYHSTLYSGHVDYPAKVGGGQQLYRQRTRPCSATEILSSSHFPEDMQGNLIVLNVIGFQGILNYKFADDGASYTAVEAKPILFSSDRNFRPVDVEVGPDGSLLFTDWTNAIIGHMQHHIRDPNRDQKHGRVYRVTYEGRPLTKPVKIAGASIEELLEVLKSMNDRERYRAKIELSARDSKEVVAAAQKWAAALDKTDKEFEHHRLEALWVHQHHNIVNEALLAEVLASPDPRARTAATRVLCYWRDRVTDPVGRLKKLCVDDDPHVRIEAVRACSFFTGDEGAAAADAALASLDKPQDEFLKFTTKQTMNTLKKYLKK